jgi:hypothetical protein
MFKRALVGAACFIFMSTMIANAGSIGSKTIKSHMDWEPDCFKPSAPVFFVTDVTSYNWAVDEFNSYVASVEMYLSCLQEEADSDLKILSKALANGLQEKTSQVVEEVNDARTGLDLERTLLR